MSEPVTCLRLPQGWREVDGSGSKHEPVGLHDVPVVIDPDLATLGLNEPGFSGSIIKLREYDEQVLLHEVLHVLIDHLVPYEPGGLNHKIINAIEVGLTAAGWRLVTP